MLAHWQGSREWDGAEAACSSSGSQGMAAAVLPGVSPGVRGQWGASLRGPLTVQQLHLVSAKGRWSGICDNRLSPAGWGHSAAHVLETPVEVFQPGVISYLLAEKWRGEALGERARSITCCCMLCSCWQKPYQDAIGLKLGTPHLAETC